MNNAQALKTYRKLSIELSAVEAQIHQTEHALHPRSAITQRYDALAGTNDPTSAAMQLLDGLEAIAAAKRRELKALQPQIDYLIAQVTDFKLLVILQRYYIHGDTDEQIATILNLSDRYICRIRNAFIRQCDTPACIITAYPVHTDAQ